MENLRKTNNPNPHNFSVLPERLELNPVNKENELVRHKKGENYEDADTGDIFVKKHYWAGNRENHLKEHFISLLIKGILHSSEMIRKGENDFFSRKIDLKDTQTGELLEKEAEIFILKIILGDYDRGIDMPAHNIEQDESDKFNHYDFGAGFKSNEFMNIHKNSRNAYIVFKEFCKENKFSKEDTYNFSFQVFNKLNKLEEAVNDDKFISAILDKTGFEPQENITEGQSKTKKIMQNLKEYFLQESLPKDPKFIKVMRIKKLLLKPIKTMKKIVRKNLK
jgi:hypothetical protein